MSLDVALQNALTGLKTVQSALQINSNNVANANTDGYTKKSAEQVSLILAGQGAGVAIADVTRQINENLVRELRMRISTMGQLSVAAEYFARTQDIFGSLTSNSSLTAGLSDLAGAFQALATSPEDAARQQAVITAAVTLAQRFNDASRDIQKMRTDADQAIATAINTVNTKLTEIADLNNQIARSYAQGQPTADLLDQRDKALSELAEQMDFTTFTRDSGEVVIVTSGGRTLLDGVAPTLSHSPIVAADPGVVYPGAIDGIDLGGADITAEIRSGRIAALVNMRDNELPALQAQIDSLATALADQINAIHNDGAGFPAANALTGTRAVTPADPVVGTGIVRIAVVDGNGHLVAAPLDLDLASVADVNDIVNAINTAFGAAATASVVNGRLQIAATNGAHGIAINEGTSAIGTQGFSHYFGLNDLFVSDGGTSLARSMRVRSDLIASPYVLSRGELSMTAAVPGDTALASGNNIVAARLAEAFNRGVSFAAAGGLPATTTTLADYSGQILGLNATAAANATSTLGYQQSLFNDLRFRADSVSGVNLDEEMASLITLQRNFGAVSRVINTASELMDVLLHMAN
ncbi:MAG TPA: flagellar hook-associated protein FlgK [Alphaproteobacteria bacterium]